MKRSRGEAGLFLLWLCVGCGAAAPPPPSRPSPVPTVPAAPEPLRAGRCPSHMVFVAGGRFQPAGSREPLDVASLCVDTTEVTVQAYQACVEAELCSPAPTDPRAASLTDASCNVSDLTRASHPINCVDALLALAYCAAHDGRLPREAEWEWIARGRPPPNPYPWGVEPVEDQACWSGVRPLDGTCGAGRNPEDVTAAGVFDLSGNVAEWTSQPLGPAPGPVADTAVGVRRHAVRGGHFASRSAEELRSTHACRSGDGQPALGADAAGHGILRLGPREVCERDALRSPAVGFRCVREALP